MFEAKMRHFIYETQFFFARQMSEISVGVRSEREITIPADVLPET